MKKVLGMGNALVDIMTRLESEELLQIFSLPKGSMQLVDKDFANKVNEGTKHLEKKQTSGGSAANTIHGLACLGVETGFIGKIGKLLKKIHSATSHSLRVTLSCGEQTPDTYRYWKECGADRYLLRIEASNPELYRKIHPTGRNHGYSKRVKALESLISLGYQTGTGVMIGLPFQTVEDLADDLLFFRDMGVHMVGMGPYVEHASTPLAAFNHLVPSVKERVRLSLNMMAVLRLLMPDINIASTTALQTLDNEARAKGIKAGANVIMPNLTPVFYKDSYLLYSGKTGVKDTPEQASESLENMIRSTGCELVKDEWGDPKAYKF